MFTKSGLLLHVLRRCPKLQTSVLPSRMIHTNRCLYNVEEKEKKKKFFQKKKKDDDEDLAPPKFEDDTLEEEDLFEEESKHQISDHMIHPEKVVEAWVTNLSGARIAIIDLPSEIFGLAPRVDMLYPVVLRQLKFKIQDEPFGSEYDLNFDRFSDKLYHNRPELKPWIYQGLAWKTYPVVGETEIQWESTSHNPIPHYNGNVPWKLRMSGLRALLSLKLRYNKLVIVDDLGSDNLLTPDELREMLNNRKITSALMITGKLIVPGEKRKGWKRPVLFPNPEPGVQKMFETARMTYACELRETGGLDVWSGLLYDTLILDMEAVRHLNDQIKSSLEHSPIPNMSLLRSLGGLDTTECLLKLPQRFKDVHVINIDNL